MPQTYFIIPTAEGEAKLANAQALGQPIKLTHLAVGDGNGVLPVPDRNRSTLVNERRRAPLNALAPDPANPSQYIAEQVIPENEGGWWIRELGLIDETGTLCFYGNCAETYKPQLAEGSGRTQVVRMVILVSAGGMVELKIDPTIVLATRHYVDAQIASELDRRDGKQSVLVATTRSLAVLSGLLTVDDVSLFAGARVLVKDQEAAHDNGIYLAAAGAWDRATDADSGLRMTPGMLVPVEQGAANGDSVWQLTTDGVIDIGADPLSFKRVGAGFFAPLSGGADFLDAVSAPTPPRQANDRILVTSEWVNARGAQFGAPYSIDASRSLTAVESGAIGVIQAANVQITLPPASSVLPGTSFTFFVYSIAFNPLFKTSRGNTIATGAGSFTQMGANGTGYVTFVAESGTVWQASGTAILGASSSFAFQALANGYQQLPSGCILQWTAAVVNGSLIVTLPKAFPNAQLSCIATSNNTSPAFAYSASPINAAQVSVVTQGAGRAGVTVWAIGY